MTETAQRSNRDKGTVDPGSERTSLFLMTNTLETGGSERQFVTMVRALDPGQFSLSLGCLKRIGPFVSEVEGLNEFWPGGNLFGLGSWRARLDLARFLREKRVQVAHAFDFYSNLMLIPAARYARIPAVVGSHRQLGDLLTPAKFRAQKTAFRWCDRVVCNSRAASDRLQAAGLAEKKLAVIPNGLPDAVFADVRPALPRDDQALRIGMISRMNDSIKRHDLFLRVAAKLAPRFPQMEFLLVGDGPLRPGLEKLAQDLSLAERVLFLGDRRDVPAVLASLDVSVLPSASESLSNVILESMAAGVPVVAANVGGNPEIVEEGKTGFLFPSEDSDKFTSVLEALAAQPELRKRLGMAARERARARYSIDTVKRQYQALYSELLSEKTHNRSIRHEPLAVNSTHEGLSR